MPYDRMRDALRRALIDESEPKQFALAPEDYNAFVAGNDTMKTGGPNGSWLFDTIPVIRLTTPATQSMLHVLPTVSGVGPFLLV